MSQNHSFISYIKNEHSFTLTIFGISIVVTSIVRFRQYLRMVFADIKLGMKFILNLNVRKIKLTISNTLLKLIMSFTSTIKIAKTRLVATMKQLLKISYTQKISKIIISGLMRMTSKFTWAPKIPKTRFTLSMIVAQFIALSIHDPKTLATMDGETLTSLDYTISP
jgi:hypothetical protein